MVVVVVEVVVVVNGKVRNPAEVTPEEEKQNERKRVNVFKVIENGTAVFVSAPKGLVTVLCFFLLS